MTVHMSVLRRLLAAAAILAATISCGDVVRQGRSPVIIVVDSFSGAPGGGRGAGQFTGTLLSDVQALVTTPDPCTTVSPCPTFFNDLARVTLHLESKDAVVLPTANNQVTIRNFRVTYRRLDGRNTPGVDIPFGFDGAVTATIPPTGSTTFGFELVRNVAKQESPLIQLVVNRNIINAIADVTLYGTDLVGNDITATASMSIEFGNFSDN